LAISSKNSEVQFSHSICPECMKRLYLEYCEEDEAFEDEAQT
jgi:hypothetical protein